MWSEPRGTKNYVQAGIVVTIITAACDRGAHGVALRSAHHRKLPDLQPAFGAVFLRFAAYRPGGFRKNQVLLGGTCGGSPVCGRTDAAGHVRALPRPGEALHHVAGRQDADTAYRRTWRGAGF